MFCLTGDVYVAHHFGLQRSLTSTSLGRELVMISMGLEAKKVSLHKKLLLSRCECFKAAFENGRFVKGQTQEIEIEEDDLEVFNLFVNWLYCDWTPSEKCFKSEEGLKMCRPLFAFTERHLLPAEVNSAAVDPIKRSYNNLRETTTENVFLFPGLIQVAFLDMREASPMRLMLLDMARHQLQQITRNNYQKAEQKPPVDRLTESITSWSLCHPVPNLERYQIEFLSRDKSGKPTQDLGDGSEENDPNSDVSYRPIAQGGISTH